MPRREFSGPVKAEIAKRAMNEHSQICCEGCGLVLGKKPYEIDHTIADGLTVDKSRKLTAKDGQLFGKECCHDIKTREHDVPAIAEAKRREARDLGTRKPKAKFQSAPKPPKPTRERLPALPPRNLYREEIR